MCFFLDLSTFCLILSVVTSLIFPTPRYITLSLSLSLTFSFVYPFFLFTYSFIYLYFYFFFLLVGVLYQLRYIYKNVNEVLPLHLLDFAADAKGKTQAELEEEKKRKALDDEYKRSQKQAKQDEAKFRSERVQVWKESATIFVSRAKTMLQTLENQMEAAKGRGQGDLSPEEKKSWVSETRSLLYRAQREVKQFKGQLPIYAKKNQILEALKKNQVLVITADTGSGKSTQLPQYIFDDALDANDDRKIAVLQPKRINAMQLKQHVGEVMAQPELVGYKLGRGTVDVTKDTRIEFMTHGLFLQLAMDPEKLLQQYACVIVDEAHERSIQIDLSLGLLRHALAYSHQKAKVQLESPDSDSKTLHQSFQVVVTSATISQEQQKQFQTFLSQIDSLSSTLPSKALGIAGRTFPVQVLYRTAVQPDPTVVGQALAGSIMSSYAVITALEILQNTHKGNILVFLPGSRDIERGMAAFRLKLKSGTRDYWDGPNLGMGFECDIEQQKDTNKSSKSKSRRSKVTTTRIGVYPLFGDASEDDRDKALNPKTPVDRRIVFCTDMAETGLTVPEVRYVIDTGYGRHVEWDWQRDMRTMRTGLISKSSMKQRTGRAGRVASGMCIRLYSRETEAALEESRTPGIQSKNLSGTLLRTLKIKEAQEAQLGRSDIEAEFKLMEAMRPETQKLAETELEELGAVDKKQGSLAITELGNKILSLGMDVPDAKFLVACIHNGCVEEGILLLAMTSTSSSQAEKYLLPQKSVKSSRAASPSPVALAPPKLAKWVDVRSDHWTLVQAYKSYQNSARNHQKIQWCREHGVPVDLMDDIDHTKFYLQNRCIEAGMKLDSDKSQGQTREGLLLALISAHYNNLTTPLQPQVASGGFARLTGDDDAQTILCSVPSTATATTTAAKPMSKSHQPAASNGTGPDHTLPSGGVQVKLSSNSVLWHTEVKDLDSGSLVVFSDIRTTDAGAASSIMSFCSLVTEKQVTEASPD